MGQPRLPHHPDMRVRIRRFRRSAQGCPQTHDMIRRPRPEYSMLPIAKALIGNLALTGVIGPDVLSVVECSFASSALADIESSGVRVYAGIFQPPARCAVLWPLLTSRGISSSGSPQVRTRCFPARPPHLPPRLNQPTSLCCARSSRRVGLDMRFLFIGPAVSGVNPPARPTFSGVSSSLPPPGRLSFRSWLQVVVLFMLS